MAVQATSHLNFDGQAREAPAFYTTVFGGEPVLVAYGDLGGVSDPDQARKIV